MIAPASLSALAWLAVALPAGGDPLSCQGLCGQTAPGGCACDAFCHLDGDCCADVCEACPLICDTSCEGHCGGLAPEGCSCEPDCFDAGTCCSDICDHCTSFSDCFSCEGYCGGKSAGHCWCDGADENHVGCFGFGDCCEDVCEFCAEVCIDTCEGYCGGVAPSGCGCDAFCFEYGDCCEDVCPTCTEVCDASCDGRCGGNAPSGCSCAPDCFDAGTCCQDVCVFCPSYTDCFSCEGYCGGQSGGACWCDGADENHVGCFVFGDCCDDVCEACPELCVDSCAGICGGQAPTGCYCNDFCFAAGNCCSDICLECGVLAGCGGVGCPGTMISADPPSGTVDARRPRDAAGNLLGIGGPDEPILVHIDDPLFQPLTDPACFEICESAVEDGAPNAVIEVSQVFVGGGVAYAVRLARPISEHAVTTIHYIGGGTLRYVSHPANVDGDGLASALDLLALIDVLNGIAAPAWGPYSSDVDHNGRLAPLDLLAEIDLLNGAGKLKPYLQTELPDDGACGD